MGHSRCVLPRCASSRNRGLRDGRTVVSTEYPARNLCQAASRGDSFRCQIRKLPARSHLRVDESARRIFRLLRGMRVVWWSQFGAAQRGARLVARVQCHQAGLYKAAFRGQTEKRAAFAWGLFGSLSRVFYVVGVSRCNLARAFLVSLSWSPRAQLSAMSRLFQTCAVVRAWLASSLCAVLASGLYLRRRSRVIPF